MTVELSAPEMSMDYFPIIILITDFFTSAKKAVEVFE